MRLVAHAASRRSLLRGHFNGAEPLRPPGALAGLAFQDSCTQCGDCARACSERIIARDAEGFPVLDPSAGACTFCDACTEACTAGALRPGRPWPWKAQAGAGCLSAQGIFCRVCDDQCEARAIRFRLAPGGRSRPEIDLAACTGCGGCIAPCPAGALSLVRTRTETETPEC